MPDRIPVAIIGGSGYVAGEALRLLSGHPVFEVAAMSSSSSVGLEASAVFPHLNSSIVFSGASELESLINHGNVAAVISALPHGESEQLLLGYGSFAPDLKIVDLSADHRFHEDFYCGLPELFAGNPGNRVANPGCFATCATLATAPLTKMSHADFIAFGVTGSTGSGRTPKPTTHHPERHSGFWAYEPLRHRHRKEILMMLGLTEEVEAIQLEDGSTEMHYPSRFVFLPHSAPMSRGMHVTVATLTRDDHPLERVKEFYKDAPLVKVRDQGFPNVKDVIGSNYCHIGVAHEGDEVAVMAVIDNLVKGAAGGGIQWLNRMFGLPDETGLTAPALGWN
jgi:N-acetyl-gamma-glutamyl-phosphate reductase common form